MRLLCPAIPFMFILCAWADAPKDFGAERDAGFCQNSVPTPAYMTDSRRGVYSDKLGADGKPICLDLRGGIRF